MGWAYLWYELQRIVLIMSNMYIVYMAVLSISKYVAAIYELLPLLYNPYIANDSDGFVWFCKNCLLPWSKSGIMELCKNWLDELMTLI